MIPTKQQMKTLGKVGLVFVGAGLIIYALLILHVVSQFDGNGTLPSDCAVVFGAAVHKNSRSGPGIERRTATAAKYYSEGQLQTLFLTGGKGDVNLDSEAEVMRRTAMRFGVAPEDIVLEDQATSTWENLLFVRPLLDDHGCSDAVAFSDRYHLARIQYLAGKQEWGNLRTLPAEKKPTVVFEVRAVLREALGLIYYFLREYIPIEDIIPPRSDRPVL